MDIDQRKKHLHPLYINGMSNEACHPNAPMGGGGCGAFVLPGPLGLYSYSRFPHPLSPAGRYLTPEDIRRQADTGNEFFRSGNISHINTQNTEVKKNNKNMTMSQDGLTLLKQIERLRLKPYDDQTSKEINAWVKGATIGYGHLIEKAEWDKYKNGISEADALALFIKNFPPYEAVVQNSITVQLKQNEFDALVMLAYNIGKGEGGFFDSSVVALVNDPNAKTNYKNLEEAWKAWNKSQGKVSQGLINRRQSEWNVYSQGVYNRW